MECASWSGSESFNIQFVLPKVWMTCIKFPGGGSQTFDMCLRKWLSHDFGEFGAQHIISSM